MAKEITYGNLYHPTQVGGVFRDVFITVGEDVYCRDIPYSGTESLLFGSLFTLIDISQFTNTFKNHTELANVFGSVQKLAKMLTDSGVWRKFAHSYKTPDEINNLWPKVLSTARDDLHVFLNNGLMGLGSIPAKEQNKRIVTNANQELKIFRVAFSDDLVNLYNHLDKTKRGCAVELNLASPNSLLAACYNELEELEKRSDLFENMRTEFDFQAKRKYLKDPSANFARAACDSLCAIKATQNYMQYNATFDDAKRISFRLFAGEPSFRGTITENEIGYVSTHPWQPGMIGDLHSHIKSRENKRMWNSAKKELLAEIKSSMKPDNIKTQSAISELSSAAIKEIYEAKRYPDKTREDLARLEKMVREIEYLKPESKSDVYHVLDQIMEHRTKIREEFGKTFPRLDEVLEERPFISIKTSSSGEKITNEVPYVFVSYVQEDSVIVDQLQHDLVKLGIQTWKDRDKLYPGLRWKSEIRQAVKDGAYFIACFSKTIEKRTRSYMLEELNLAIEELRMRPKNRVWFLPVKLEECEIPDWEIGGGETLHDIQYLELYSDWSKGVSILASIIRGNLNING